MTRNAPALDDVHDGDDVVQEHCAFCVVDRVDPTYDPYCSLDCAVAADLDSEQRSARLHATRNGSRR